MKFISVFVFVLCLTQNVAAKVSIDLKNDMGASGKMEDLATTVIQSAVDSCVKAGGGTVVFPEGIYLSGTIFLHNNITLHLKKGAVLMASLNSDDYPMPLEGTRKPALLYALRARGITIEGEGMIHGQAKREYLPLKKVDDFIANETEIARAAGLEMKMWYIVPPNTGLIMFYQCHDIKMSGVTFYEATYWTMHLRECIDIDINGITIYSDLNAGVNADGIDIDACSNVHVQNCKVETGDDAIVVKNKSRNGYKVDNILVENCTISSSSSALKVGTETYDDIFNVTFRDCVVENTNRGLSIVIRDGAKVDGITFKNIQLNCSRRHFNWWGDGDPLHILIKKRTPARPQGTLHNVVFENISGTAVGSSRFINADSTTTSNIVLRNIDIHLQNESTPDKRANLCFEMQNMMDVKATNVSFNWKDPINSPSIKQAVRIKNCTDVQMDNITAPKFGASKVAMIEGGENVKVNLK